MSTNDSEGAAPADYVALFLSPLLIMALVGSLVFFLLEILYAGQHLGNMQWILFFFVFAAILVARISLTPDIAGRAPAYMAIIGLLGWLAFLRFVEYPEHLKSAAPLISLGIIGLVLWCAHRLTWDCTWMDDKVGVAGEGLLQASGLEKSPEASSSVERYQKKQQDEDGQRRTPGTWIVYFSLAALPIFGLGQSLIPPDELSRRRFTFWLMIIYVGSGLGLLLTTSFLGLRLYLHRRRLRMPIVMTTCWLTLGGLLIVGLLTAGALMPRPNAEVALFNLEAARGKKRDASRKNVRDGKPGEGKGDQNKGQQGSKDRQPEQDKDRQAGKDQPDKDRQAGKDQPDKDGQTDRAAGQNGKDRQQSGKDRQAERDGKDKKDPNNQKDRSEQGDQQQQGNSEPPPDRPNLSLDKLMSILKWIVFAILALLVLFVVLRGVLRFVAGFSTWARNLLEFFRRFWESLLGLFRGTEATSEKSEEDEEQERLAQLPFSAFSNPFEDGRAAQLSPADLTRYTFAALEAWGRERDLARQSGETALEFTHRVGEEVPPLERESLRLGQLYSIVVYGRGGVPANAREVLQRFWETLARATSRPMSA